MKLLWSATVLVVCLVAGHAAGTASEYASTWPLDSPPFPTVTRISREHPNILALHGAAGRVLTGATLDYVYNGNDLLVQTNGQLFQYIVATPGDPGGVEPGIIKGYLDDGADCTGTFPNRNLSRCDGGVTCACRMLGPDTLLGELLDSVWANTPVDFSQFVPSGSWFPGSGVPLMDFTVVDDATGAVVYGPANITLVQDPSAIEDFQGGQRGRTQSKTYIFEAAFPGFVGAPAPAKFRVVVAHVGSSQPFEVRHGVYNRAVELVGSALYYHRSGVPLDPAYATYARGAPQVPTPANPYLYSLPIMYTGSTGLGEYAEAFSTITREAIPGSECLAKGGSMDAGDWDRRITHVALTQALCDLFDLDAEFFAGIQLSQPPSSLNLPPLLEAAWRNIDMYIEYMAPDGGVIGGIEFEEHPVIGEVSTDTSLKVYCHSPDPWASYLAASGAARLARVSAQYNAAFAADLEAKAELAFSYGEAHLHDPLEAKYMPLGNESDPNWPNFKYFLPKLLRDARNTAAADLFRLTGKTEYETVFEATSVFTIPGREVSFFNNTYSDYEWRQEEGAWVYASTPGATNIALQAECSAAVRRTADDLIANMNNRGLAIARSYFWPAVDLVTVRQEIPRALFLMPNSTIYRDAVERSLGFGLGANPRNEAFITGICGPKERLGYDRGSCVEQIVHVDTSFRGLRSPPGIPVLGPLDGNGIYGPTVAPVIGSLFYPAMATFPPAECFAGFHLGTSPMTEYTIHETFAPMLLQLGTLAMLGN